MVFQDVHEVEWTRAGAIGATVVAMKLPFKALTLFVNILYTTTVIWENFVVKIFS